MASEEQGIVKMYSAERGFGFIVRDGGEDVFVPRAAVERAGLSALVPGEVIFFTLRRAERGPQAEHLRRANAAAAPQERTAGEPLAPNLSASPPAARLGASYLRDGYFETRGEQPCIRPELLDGLAIGVAHALGQAGMRSNQLRRFLSRARGIESRFAQSRDYHTLVADVYAFKRDVAYQVGRKLLPEPFQQFISRNIEVSVTDPEHFRRGFIPHFESVVAYFAYYFREQ